MRDTGAVCMGHLSQIPIQSTKKAEYSRLKLCEAASG